VAVGDEVNALIDFDRDGAAAEYAAVPASALAARPGSVSHVQAATLPLAALTAWQALVDRAGLAVGERALVQGGAGGVGVYAVQFAAVLGGQVTASGAARARFSSGTSGPRSSSVPGRRPARARRTRPPGKTVLAVR
jgi:NADPH:quinone reductase-like Zn-dependent oxidoreductase